MPNNKNHRQALGAKGEAIARNLYIKKGYLILISNFTNDNGRRVGELDFVALKANDIRFVEVKTRSSYFYGDPVESVSQNKVLRIRKAISHFFIKFPKFVQLNPHFDVVTIKLNLVDKKIEKIRIYIDVIVDSY